MERVEAAAGVAPAGGVAVPLLLGDMTWGVLGFLHFGLHLWSPGRDPDAPGDRLDDSSSSRPASTPRSAREYNATHDDLTGLPNRRALLARSKRAARRQAPHRGPGHRPRPVQGDERLPGPRQRRPAPDHDRRPHPHEHPGQRLRRAPGRRRVRLPRRRRQERDGGPGDRLPDPRRHRQADRRRRPGGQPHREHRHRHRSDSDDQNGTGPARLGRRRDVRGEGPRPQPGRRLRRGAARGRRASARAPS